MGCVCSPSNGTGSFTLILPSGHYTCSDQAWADVEASLWEPTSGTQSLSVCKETMFVGWGWAS